MGSEGLIFGRCLLNFHVKLPFCDIEDMLLLFSVDWWFPGASLLFIFLCVATSGVTHYLPKRPFSLMNNTSPSHPETMKQTDCSSRGSPLPLQIMTVVSPPSEPGPRNIPSFPFFVNGQLFFVTLSLAVPIVWACSLAHRAVFLNSTLDGGVFLCLKCKLHLNNDLRLHLHGGFYSYIRPHGSSHFDRHTNSRQWSLPHGNSWSIP